MNKSIPLFFLAILVLLLSRLFFTNFSGSLIEFFSGLVTGLLIVASLYRLTHKNTLKD